MLSDMDREKTIDVLEEIAVLLELKGENSFKIRAYQSAARALEQFEGSWKEVLEEGKLQDIKGVGEAIARKIEILNQEGKLPYHEELLASTPPGLLEMLEIPGLGGKKVHKMYQELGIETLEELGQACEDGRVGGLKGFGAKTAEKILSGIANRAAYGARHLRADLEPFAESTLEGLRGLKEVQSAAVAGSYRRGLETAGDLDFIAAAEEPVPVMDWFVGLDGIAEVTAHGKTKSSIRLEDGLQADLRVVPPSQYAFALHHFTGSKDHNVAMRQRALRRGYSLSEWGLERRDESAEAVPPIDSETGLFEFLGLAPIVPELREGMGEIEVAAEGRLPRLLELGDIKGAFHNHTRASDGQATLEEMAAAASALGWEYLGIADHSKAAYQANGLNEERVREQMEAIAALNASGKVATHVFSGVECDILKDGSLDLDDDLLAALDYVVVSIHSSFSLSEEEMTARLIRAIEHPSTTMVGHLTGRLLLRREGYRVNLKKIIDAALANGVWIELNAHPSRLDLDWRHWRKAAGKGVLCVINPDAHRVNGLKDIRHGLTAARKGWIEPASVVNTRGLDEVRKLLG